MESLHCNFHSVKITNCTYHKVEHNVLSTLWKLSAFFSQNHLYFLNVTIQFVNYSEYFFYISSVEPTDLRELPQILLQFTKFLPRACWQRSSNIPSLALNKNLLTFKLGANQELDSAMDGETKHVDLSVCALNSPPLSNAQLFYTDIAKISHIVSTY